MVAGESSGDQLGADLIRSLKLRHPGARFVGIGGPKMIQEGFETWYPMEKLSVMGLFEVLSHLKELLALRKSLIEKLLSIQPDVFIGIDAPDFNFKVEETMKHHQITAVHYVGPSVWAWREKRLNKIRRQVDGVLVLFPFELAYYHKYQIPAQFVGHPLASQIPETPDTLGARQALHLEGVSSVTAVLPGSRMSEISLMMDVYVQAMQRLRKPFPKMTYLVPCVHDKARKRIEQSIHNFGQGLDIRLFDQQADLVLEACDQALVTSGTATLQAALYKKPLVLAIKLHPITHWLMRRMATTQWIGLPNVLANETLVTELIQSEASPEKIAQELQVIMTDNTLRERQILAFTEQHHQLKQDASEKAADAIEQWAFRS